MNRKNFLTEEEIQARIAAEAASDKERKMTPEQLTAIYSNGTNILVSASAGSGKTFVMVERILDMISRGVSINQLFISTFTVKAAGELKERLEKGLTRRLGEAASDEERQHFAAQIAAIPTADIGTMDAFCQKLVNQYGYLMGISPIFRIMTDESEQDILKKQVYSDLFAKYMQGNQAQLFQQLVRNFAGRRKDSQAFREVIYQIHQFSQSTASPSHWLKEVFLQAYEHPQTSQPGDLVQTILAGQDLNQILSKAEAYFKDHYETVTQEFQKSYKYLSHVATLIEELASFPIHANLEEIQKACARIDAISSGRNLVMAIGSSKDETLKSYAAAYNRDRNRYLEPLRNLAQSLFTILALEPHQADILPLLQLLRDFVEDFSAQYLAAKLQENAFEFNDIAHFAIQILEDNPSVAQIFKDKYQEVMVDEYQDNNHMQERLLELLSNGHNRFMVGDIKQSIYRFRQADPLIFNSKFKLYQDHPEAGKLILLKENFRSQSTVLDSTNGVFSHLMDEQVGDILYDQTHLLVAGSAAQKAVVPQQETEVLIYNTEEVESSIEEEDSSFSQGEIDLVAKEIIRLHNEEGVKFSDITLLVASRTRNEPLIASFEQYGIPVQSDGGEKNYLKSLEVMIMLDTLRVIDNPLNDFALTALLRSPMFAFDEDQLARLAVQADQTELYQKLLLAKAGQGQHPQLISPALMDKLTHFLDQLAAWRQFSKTNSLYDLIWKIYNDRLYYDYVGALPHAERRQTNLYALALRANGFEKTGFKGLARFIGMIDKVLESDKDLMEVEVAAPQNAVNLMTIHHSKGLEFKYVFILNIDKRFSMKDSQSPLILSREKGLGIKYLADMKDQVQTQLPHLKVAIETLPYQINRRELNLATLSEQMRLLYVAMTRAEKKLYLVGKGRKDKLTEKFDGSSENGFLPASQREGLLSFQDWLLAIDAAFPSQDLAYRIRFVEQEEVLPSQIGQLKGKVDADNLAHNRQSEDIRRALEVLDSVDRLNQAYAPAIKLPSLRTPSQVKAFYEPVMDTEGMEIMDRIVSKKEQPIRFHLPQLSQENNVTSTAIGSATHELMQRLQLSQQVSLADLEQALDQVQAPDQVKERMDLQKILSFFDTELGQLILSNLDKLYREAPFAMLEEDPISKEPFVIRGIVDGYLVLEDRIVLFDYKTDKYQKPSQLHDRYAFQMKLYTKALQESYQIKQIDAYLILLGGQKVEIVRVENSPK